MSEKEVEVLGWSRFRRAQVRGYRRPVVLADYMEEARADVAALEAHRAEAETMAEKEIEEQLKEGIEQARRGETSPADFSEYLDDDEDEADADDASK